MPVASTSVNRPSRIPRWREPGFLLSAAVALVLGVAVGRGIAYFMSQGGLWVITAAFITILTGFGVIVAAVAWPVVARLLRRSPRSALASVGMTTIVLAAGIGVGAATARLTGATYHPPVTLQAAATIQANLSGPGLDTATANGTAGTCDSEPDSRAIASVTALDLGSFGTGRLRGFLTFSPDGTVDGWALIDGSDSAPDVLPIQWAGTLRVMSISPDRTKGDVYFPEVALVTDSKLPGASVAPEWPRTMTGDVSWQCQPWQD
jgi:hypothetical protein